MTNDLDRYVAETIAAGSKSFARAARLYPPATRRSVMQLYAWCRYADDAIDGQMLGHGQTARTPEAMRECLAQLQAETARALAGEATEIPAFQALREVAARHRLDPRHPAELLEGFAMDADERRYADFDALLTYCYHVAGVVGRMMAQVMGVHARDTLDRATDLGLAFQLTNIARDVVEDAGAGRLYLPQDWLREMGIAEAEIALPEHRPALFALSCRLVEAAEPYYASARIGLRRLPFRSAWAIATALLVYRRIGLDLRRGGVEVWARRVGTSGARKWLCVAQGAFLALLPPNRNAAPRTGLWTRPQAVWKEQPA